MAGARRGMFTSDAFVGNWNPQDLSTFKKLTNLNRYRIIDNITQRPSKAPSPV